MPATVKRLAPLSLRLNAKERASLESRAGGVGLSTYAKSVLFGVAPERHARQRRAADEVLLAQVLARLGASGIPSELRQLRMATESGVLPLDEMTARRLREACDEVRELQRLIVGALGKRPDARKGRAVEAFARAAVEGAA